MTRWADTDHRQKRDRVVPIAPSCLQNKLGFTSRRDAKRWITSRQLVGNRPYPCVQPDCELFHYGHLPLVVIKGVIPRRELSPRGVLREKATSSS